MLPRSSLDALQSVSSMAKGPSPSSRERAGSYLGVLITDRTSP
jgi:hypothetical protein